MIDTVFFTMEAFGVSCKAILLLTMEIAFELSSFNSVLKILLNVIT